MMLGYAEQAPDNIVQECFSQFAVFLLCFDDELCQTVDYMSLR